MISERTAAMCNAFKSGEPVAVIADQFGVQNKAIYKALRRGGLLPEYRTRVPGGRKQVQQVTPSKKSAAPTPIADRTPCFLCGVRGDIGCKHKSN